MIPEDVIKKAAFVRLTVFDVDGVMTNGDLIFDADGKKYKVFIDIPAMAAAGLSIAVADAHPRVREKADWISSKPGGRGAVREISELVLDSQGRLEMTCQRCLSI